MRAVRPVQGYWSRPVQNLSEGTKASTGVLVKTSTELVRRYKGQYRGTGQDQYRTCQKVQRPVQGYWSRPVQNLSEGTKASTGVLVKTSTELVRRYQGQYRGTGQDQYRTCQKVPRPVQGYWSRPVQNLSEGTKASTGVLVKASTELVRRYKGQYRGTGQGQYRTCQKVQRPVQGYWSRPVQNLSEGTKASTGVLVKASTELVRRYKGQYRGTGQGQYRTCQKVQRPVQGYWSRPG